MGCGGDEMQAGGDESQDGGLENESAKRVRRRAQATGAAC